MGTGQGVRLFPQRVYEVSVMENQLTPLQLIDLNSTDEIAHKPSHYSIVGTDYRGLSRYPFTSFHTKFVFRKRSSNLTIQLDINLIYNHLFNDNLRFNANYKTLNRNMCSNDLSDSIGILELQKLNEIRFPLVSDVNPFLYKIYTKFLSI